MPTTARDEIIAEWRTRLADAEEPIDVHSPRTAWLTRLRQRLYRFLLSLYGDGQWNSSESPSATSLRPEPLVVSEEVLPLVGTPAKDECKIRAVLKSVAGANDSAIKPGPWASGKARHDLGPATGERGGSLVCNLSFGAMIGSVSVLVCVAVASSMGPAINSSPLVQSFKEHSVVLGLACFITSAIVYGMFAQRREL